MSNFEDRKKHIISILAKDGSATVSELSKIFNVSEVTIRSDLTNLENQGLLSRKHGKAITAIHPGVLTRQNLGLEKKICIAKAAAKLVKDNDTIMIEAGTTAALIPHYLTDRRDVHIITNSMLAFQNARTNPTLRITVIGGEYCIETDSFIGSIAAEIIRKFNVKYAFVGTDGFSVKAGITTHYVEAAQMIKVMREKAEKIVLVSDSSKYNRIGVVNILPLSAIDLIITDSEMQLDGIEELRKSGCNIEISQKMEDTNGKSSCCY